MENDPADLLVLPGESQSRIENVVLNPSSQRIVINAGKLVANRELKDIVF